jgi:hypothetical protein
MNLTNQELAQVTALAELQVRQEKHVEYLEEQLKQAKKELLQTSDSDLPNAMAEIGMTSFTLTNGHKISIKEEVYASIPKEGQDKAFSWLRSHDFGALIKNQIIAEFGKGEDNAAHEAAMLLAEHGWKPTQKESVHPMTLKAFIREQLSEGREIPLDFFGATVVNRAIVK